MNAPAISLSISLSGAEPCGMYPTPLDAVRVQFIDTLDAKKADIAHHVLAAWDGEDVDNINANLDSARSLLQQIAGSAGAHGFTELGATAHHCEAQITAHLEGDYADLAICPGEIMWFVDTFVEACAAVVAPS